MLIGGLWEHLIDSFKKIKKKWKFKRNNDKIRCNMNIFHHQTLYLELIPFVILFLLTTVGNIDCNPFSSLLLFLYIDL